MAKRRNDIPSMSNDSNDSVGSLRERVHQIVLVELILNDRSLQIDGSTSPYLRSLDTIHLAIGSVFERKSWSTHGLLTHLVK